jgi:hypothetical protein
MVDIEGILEEVVVKVMGRASRKNGFWLISMDRDCSRQHFLDLNLPVRSKLSLDFVICGFMPSVWWSLIDFVSICCL